MTSSQPSEKPPFNWKGMPRWAAPIFVMGGTLIVHVGLPFVLSLLVPRFGWEDGGPSLWNLVGLLPVAAGLSMIAWASREHVRKTQGDRVFEATPSVMLVHGAYRYSRNPMYLVELVMWFGWAIFYGSIPVLIAFVLWWATFNFYMIPLEERLLEARFGEAYLDYKRTVPRWFGLPRA